MTAAPEPLVSAEVDLRNFEFMPLDVVRLRDSGLAAKATGDEFRAAVLLWCASWHQVPAASLPDDDAELANLCGYGRAQREWKKVREGALRGWILCADGRLYHPTVAAKARDAWQSKVAQRARTEAARKAREAARQKQSQIQPQPLSQNANPSVTDTATESKGQGQGQGQGLEKIKPSRPAAGEVLADPPPPDPNPPAPPPAPPEPDPGRELWANAIAMLRAQGITEPSARSFIGLQCRSWDDDTVADAFSAAAGQANVKGYVLAVLKGKPKRSERPKGVEFRHGQATIGGFVP